MDPRALRALLALPLVACSSSPEQPSVYRQVSVAPVPDWPERPELPQDDHPPHGEGTESPMYLGVGGYTNISNTATVTVHSSFSGSYASTAPAVVEDHVPFSGLNPATLHRAVSACDVAGCVAARSA